MTDPADLSTDLNEIGQEIADATFAIHGDGPAGQKDAERIRARLVELQAAWNVERAGFVGKDQRAGAQVIADAFERFHDAVDAIANGDAAAAMQAMESAPITFTTGDTQ